jgi:hypothetical protein
LSTWCQTGCKRRTIFAEDAERAEEDHIHVGHQWDQWDTIILEASNLEACMIVIETRLR